MRVYEGELEGNFKLNSEGTIFYPPNLLSQPDGIRVRDPPVTIMLDTNEPIQGRSYEWALTKALQGHTDQTYAYTGEVDGDDLLAIGFWNIKSRLPMVIGATEYGVKAS